ncbi:imm11 family protein [Solimonas sp. K1W22B-7]|uniref:imm11 family protein n=1 Tax=Solimonas sp. K1W22B-7 TaxID=2303331 RepID=UPI0013C41DC7|nr:DUF1629 domain-containing protein [Solimonas sp. K1W22B-7]
MTKFFRLIADSEATDRWYLKAPINSLGKEVDPRLFTEGKAFLLKENLTIPIRQNGRKVEFNFGAFDMIVTPAKLNAKLVEVAGVSIQRIPACIESVSQEFEILNVLDKVNCIDESASRFVKWTVADGRPEKIGQYRMISPLRINGDAAEGRHLFRVNEWPIALIASESIKNLLAEQVTSGVQFEAVN